MLALPGAQGPPPWALSAAAAAAFVPDSFYGFQAEGYEAQHTLGELGVLGQGQWPGGWGVSLQYPPSVAGDVWLGRVSTRARGAAQRPSAARGTGWRWDSEPLHGLPASPGH